MHIKYTPCKAHYTGIYNKQLVHEVLHKQLARGSQTRSRASAHVFKTHSTLNRDLHWAGSLVPDTRTQHLAALLQIHLPAITTATREGEVG